MNKYSYDLSVIIVSWNVKSYLLNCIESIIANFSNISYEIILVDNASTDHTVETIEDRFKAGNLKIIRNTQNVGFAKGNRQGTNIAEGKAILYLNPDTVILDTNITILLNKLWSNCNIGIVGCRVLNYDFTIQKTCARYSPTLIRNLFNFVFMSEYLRIFHGKGMYYRDLNYNKIMNVECISGCFMLLKKEIIDKCGSFDDSFFMYAEDIELCNRIRNSGYMILYVPEMEMIHYGGKSSIQHQKNNFGIVKKYESDFQYFVRLHGENRAKVLRLLIWTGSLLRIACLSFNKLWIKRHFNKEIDPVINKHRAVMRWVIRKK